MTRRGEDGLSVQRERLAYEDDEDAKTVLVARRPAEAWDEFVADLTTPAARPSREDPALVDDGSLDVERPRPPAVQRIGGIDTRVLAVAIGALVPVLVASALYLLI